MMPWMKNYGISHKIEDEEERKRLAQLFDESKAPKGHGFIIRTAGEGASKRDIQADLKYLDRLWRAMQQRMDTEKAPGEIYLESDLVIRALRDLIGNDIVKIVCDSDATVRKIKDFLSIAAPRLKPKVVYYDEKIPVFHKYQIEEEIAKIQAREVELKSGGSIVIEQTEALVAIDVNSGRFRRQKNAEQTAYENNLEAANEIARQLRLRDLGGLIVCDFIDMRNPKHRKEVERIFRDAVRKNGARSISHQPLQRRQKTQRMQPSLQFSTFLACRTARHRLRQSREPLALGIIRLLNWRRRGTTSAGSS
jgi:ribonuclease E